MNYRSSRCDRIRRIGADAATNASVVRHSTQPVPLGFAIKLIPSRSFFMLVSFSALTFNFMAVPPGMDSLSRRDPRGPNRDMRAPHTITTSKPMPD
jgi:hypothetical protein